MWVLSHVKSGDRFYLLGDSEEITVGRLACNILLSDGSVSRKHAMLLRSTTSVRLKDLNSRHGTFLNFSCEPIAKYETFDVKEGDLIRFGRLENTYRLEKIKFSVCSSKLKADGIEKLRNQLKVIDGAFMADWSTQCTHLIMPNITSLTVKALQSLAQGVPIVTPEFFDAFVQTVRKQKNVLPNVSNFIPKVTDTSIKLKPGMLNVRTGRRQIFQNKTFVFMATEQMLVYKPIITLAGGKCLAMDADGVANGVWRNKDCICLKYTAQTTPQTISNISDVKAFLASKNRRMGAVAEIAYALLNCSIDSFCNPERELLHTECAPSSTDHDNKPNLTKASSIVPSNVAEKRNVKKRRNDSTISKSLQTKVLLVPYHNTDSEATDDDVDNGRSEQFEKMQTSVATQLLAQTTQKDRDNTEPIAKRLKVCASEGTAENKRQSNYINVKSYQVEFPAGENENEHTFFKYEDVQSAFKSINFESMQKTYKDQEVTAELCFNAGANLMSTYFPEVQPSNSAEQQTNEICIYIAVPGHVSPLDIQRKKYLGVTAGDPLGRNNNRISTDWKKTKSPEFRNDVLKETEMALKYIKVVAPGKAYEEVNTLKLFLEKCVLQYMAEVNLKGNMYNVAKGDTDSGNLVALMPDRSSRLKLGAFLWAQLVDAPHKFVGQTINYFRQKLNSLGCDQCAFTAHTKRGLTLHMRAHVPAKEASLQCETCSVKFNSSRKKQAHIANAHPQKCTIRCHICKRCFKQTGALSRHNNAFHTPQTTCSLSKCEICQGVFTNDNYLREHMNTVHSVEKHYCEICDIVFTANGKHMQHNFAHHGGPALNQCEQCGASFVKKVTLTHHIRDMHGMIKEYQCYICRTRLPKCQAKVKDHLRIKHPLRNQNTTQEGVRYRCGHCHQTSPWKWILENHCRTVHQTQAYIEEAEGKQLFTPYRPLKKKGNKCCKADSM